MGGKGRFLGEFWAQFPKYGEKGLILDVKLLKITQKVPKITQNTQNSCQICIYTTHRGGFSQMFRNFEQMLDKNEQMFGNYAQNHPKTAQIWPK